MLTLAPDHCAEPRQDGGIAGAPGTSDRSAPDIDSVRGAYLYMDAYRALLAAAVAFGHVWVLFVQDYVPTASRFVQALYVLAGFAHAAVVMFFVLSGYWITRSVVTRSGTGWSWPGYLIDRLARLLVVLIPAVALGGVLDAVSLWVLRSPTHLGLTHSWVLNKDVAADLSVVTLLGNLAFLQGIVVHSFGTNGPLWSLAVEFWCYLWFPALWLLFRHGRPSWALLSLGLAVLQPQLLGYFATWLCGSMLFLLQQARAARTPRSPLVGAAVTGAATLALAAALAWERMGSTIASDLTLAVAFAAFLYATIAQRPGFPRRFEALARFGARSSFSLYAIHFPVIAAIAAIVVVPERLAPTTTTILIAAAAMLASFAAAYLFSGLTEARTDRVRRTLRRTFLRARCPDATASR